MKSVGEVMAIGRTFQESLQKALRGLETGWDGLNEKIHPEEDGALETIKHELREPGPERILYVADAFRAGLSVEEVYELSKIDPWFLVQIEDLVELEKEVVAVGKEGLDAEFLRALKRKGFSDRRLAKLAGISEDVFRKLRHNYGVRPVYKRVDTCAAEFASSTAYLYSTYEEECEALPNQRD